VALGVHGVGAYQVDYGSPELLDKEIQALQKARRAVWPEA
jgi:hypothetical protein